LISALACGREAVLPKLQKRVVSETRPPVRARLAITLLHLGDTGSAASELAHKPDPKYRTALIHTFPTWHGDLQPLGATLEGSADAAFRSGLCAAIGLVDPNSLAEEKRRGLKRVLEQLYRAAPDGGTHSAAAWALTKWALAPLPSIEPAVDPPPDRRWFETRLGLTLVKCPQGKFIMGDTGSPGAKTHEVVIPQPFFISSTEISVALFRQFVDDPVNQSLPQLRGWDRNQRGSGAGEDSAAGSVRWSEAILFCNWLSLKEGRRPCYLRETRPEQGTAASTQIWKLDPQGAGYRLPTGEEWEYACRGGTQTGFCFGDDPRFLPEYGRYIFNAGRPGPGMTKLPNAWGLFDMHGNLSEWCWEGQPPGGSGQPETRPARGGNCFDIHSGELRSGRGSLRFPTDVRHLHVGFRVMLGLAEPQ
jgi:eukaryotic-like serine/threonine-protein kinase